jgi:acetylornithine deacetylase/succinyl-diaminopimelate desuccinylase-like protein
MYNLLQRNNELSAARAVKFTQRLVREPSKCMHEERVADLVEQEMRAICFDRILRDSVGNVVSVKHGREKDLVVLLASHMDTVGIGDESNWPFRPYQGVIVDGRLHGRGAADCKSGLAAQVYAGDLLIRSLLPLRGTIVIAATVAEENGRSVGLRALMDQTLPELGLSPDYALLGEPTDLGLYYGHDGWAQIDISVEGSDAGQVNHAVRDLETDIGFLQLSPPERPRSAVHVGLPQIEKCNGVRRACIPLYCRISEGDRVESILQRIQCEASLATRQVAGVAVDVAVQEQEQRLYTGKTTQVKKITQAWSTDPFGHLMERSRQALQAAGVQSHPGKWHLGRLGTGTGGGVLVNEFDVPTIGFGPGHEDQAHTVDEYVRVENIGTAVYGTAAICHALVGVPVCGWTSDEI